jgi:hypothetical protein
LGRNPTNDVRISDPSVSSFHAEIVFENDTIRIRDLGSTNGTFIDDVKATEGLLTPRTTLRLGNVKFAIEELSVAQACAVPAGASPSAPSAQVDLAPGCAYHAGTRAAYRCENCGGCFCEQCVTVVGQGKFCATTICPVCKAQCYPLPSQAPDRQRQGLLGRLSHTLKVPFSK